MATSQEESKNESDSHSEEYFLLGELMQVICEGVKKVDKEEDPFERYQQELKERVYGEVEKSKERFNKGYEILLEELLQHKKP